MKVGQGTGDLRGVNDCEGRPGHWRPTGSETIVKVGQGTGNLRGVKQL